jgi:hypothetical protein
MAPLHGPGHNRKALTQAVASKAAVSPYRYFIRNVWPDRKLPASRRARLTFFAQKDEVIL